MTVQTIKIGKREFVLLPKRDFEKLTSQARLQSEDDYWAESALKAEARAKARGEKPIPFAEVEKKLDARNRAGGKRARQ